MEGGLGNWFLQDWRSWLKAYISLRKKAEERVVKDYSLVPKSKDFLSEWILLDGIVFFFHCSMPSYFSSHSLQGKQLFGVVVISSRNVYGMVYGEEVATRIQGEAVP